MYSRMNRATAEGKVKVKMKKVDEVPDKRPQARFPTFVGGPSLSVSLSLSLMDFRFFCATRRKKGPRSTMAFGSLMVFFFSSECIASKDANGKFSQHVNTQILLFLFIQHCCIFDVCFMHFCRMSLSFFFVRFCGRIGNDTLR